MPHVYALTWVQYEKDAEPKPCRLSYHATPKDMAEFISNYLTGKLGVRHSGILPQENTMRTGHVELSEVQVCESFAKLLRKQAFGSRWMPLEKTTQQPAKVLELSAYR